MALKSVKLKAFLLVQCGHLIVYLNTLFFHLGLLGMPRHIITLLLFCCISLTALADEIRLNDQHPDRHVVVKGDTLWGIAGQFLKDPWQWPNVWQLNRQQIKNPHLIYPGNVVYLDMSSGSPQLKLLLESVTLEPGIQVEPLAQAAIPSLNLSAIKPFLNQAMVIEKAAAMNSARILAAQDERLVLSPGTRIYVDSIQPEDGPNWQIVRDTENLIDPDSKEVLGQEARYLGEALIKQYGSPASAEIVSASEEIFSGDRLLIRPPEQALTNFVPHAPETAISGRIISIYSGVDEAGPLSVVAINRGGDAGLELGHVLTINRAGRIIKNPQTDQANKRIPLPDERIGMLMVFRVFERVSYALIMQASEPINKLDSVLSP
jgi:hypothetical protein